MKSLNDFAATIRICQIYYGINWDVTFAPGDESDPDPKHPIAAMFKLERPENLTVVQRELDEILALGVDDKTLDAWFFNLNCTTVGELSARDMLVLLRDAIANSEMGREYNGQ